MSEMIIFELTIRKLKRGQFTYFPLINLLLYYLLSQEIAPDLIYSVYLYLNIIVYC